MSRNFAELVVPVRLAYTGLACANCMEIPEKLVQCSGCKLAKYCNKNCQRADWKKHKAECEILKAFRENYDTIPGSCLLHKAANMKPVAEMMIQKGELPSKVKKSWPRHNKFLSFGRVCSVCKKNDFQSSDEEQLDWKNCPTCKFGWCCSDEHWGMYKERHTEAICQYYVFSSAIEVFLWRHCKKHNDTFLCLPHTSLSEVMEAFPSSWQEYFKIRLAEVHGLSLTGRLLPEYLPAATRELSLVTTCLYAMYEHGIESFQNLSTLTMHVVGASQNYEVPPTCVWEEIMHCLPKVQALKISFVGPEACCVLDEENFPMREMECCPTCKSRKRKRFVAMHGLAYHDYYNKYLENPTDEESLEPDLIVAFNTGMHECDVASWKTSLEVVLDLNVPAFFTSYNRSEADQDYEVLKGVNAKMLHKDGPKRNPFAEMKPEIDAADNGTDDGIDNFYHKSMYCIAFKGRTE